MRGDFIGSGWAYPLGVNANGSIALATGISELEQAMQLILLTYPGERPMRWEFGCRLRDYVFDGATFQNATAIANEVRAALLRWEPRVEVSTVDVDPATDRDGLLYIDINYVVKATNDRRNLVFPFYTIPRSDGEN
jgi:hypothetical protein